VTKHPVSVPKTTGLRQAELLALVPHLFEQLLVFVLTHFFAAFFDDS
jgi:hypothetical protein